MATQFYPWAERMVLLLGSSKGFCIYKNIPCVTNIINYRIGWYSRSGFLCIYESGLKKNMCTHEHTHSCTHVPSYTWTQGPRTHAPAKAVKQHAIGCGTLCRCAQEQKKQRTHVHEHTRAQEQEKRSFSRTRVHVYIRTYFLTLVCTLLSIYILSYIRTLSRTFESYFLRTYVIASESE